MPRRTAPVTPGNALGHKTYIALPKFGSTFQLEPTMQTATETEATNSALPQYGSKPKKPGMYFGPCLSGCHTQVRTWCLTASHSDVARRIFRRCFSMAMDFLG